MQIKNNFFGTLVFGFLALGQTLWAQLPDPGFTIDNRTAIVITDPQNDFLSENGVAWGLVGPSVTQNGTIENIATLFELAAKHDMPVLISPHMVNDHDHQWEFAGAMLTFAKQVHLMKKGKSTEDGVALGTHGADIYTGYHEYLKNDDVIVTSPHKVFGPESNDLILQLRKRKIDKVILAGMLSNLCTESHLRELVEQGFEVAVVKDATAAAILPDMDGYKIAQANFSLIANHVYTTEEIKAAFLKL